MTIEKNMTEDEKRATLQQVVLKLEEALALSKARERKDDLRDVCMMSVPGAECD